MAIHTLLPPAIGTIVERFIASFLTDNDWKGHGSFSYGGRNVDNVPVAPSE